MAEGWEETYDTGNQSEESNHEKLRIEPLYEAFICPLTEQVMRDPVTLEHGQTFEREAIEKWFRECRASGRRPVCPLTLKELKTTDLKPSVALRVTIEEWERRNETVQLDSMYRSLTLGSTEADVLQALDYIIHICQKSSSNKHVVATAESITMISDLLKSSSSRVRCKALETLRVLAEGDTKDKQAMAVGDTIRRIVKFLADEHFQERDLAVSLLYELSKSDFLAERIGLVNGAILLLVGLSSSKPEHILAVGIAEKTLKNMENCEENIRQMAENGRVQPLLALLLEGIPEMQLSMAEILGKLVLSNDMKVLVARTAGSTLVGIMRSGSKPAREAALKALNQISSCEISAKILIQAGILPPLVQGLFALGANQLPVRLKEVSATVLANVVSSGSGFESFPIGDADQTLISEDIIHNLLHLISNTGPAIESKLLQVLVGFTSCSKVVENVVAAIKSSGATINLIEFVEAPQRDLRMASIKLLHNMSPYMGEELANGLVHTAGLLRSLLKTISEFDGISEEQAAAVGLLAGLPERDSALTRQLLDEGAFDIVISKLLSIQQGSTGGSRFVAPFVEGLVRVLSRLTYLLHGMDIVAVIREYNLAALFTNLLDMNGLDKVQAISALALENLSTETKHLTRVPEVPQPGFCGTTFACFGKQQVVVSGLCTVHHGICSIKESFCLVEGKAVRKLVACLDHGNEKLVEAALAALCTLLEDGVDVEQGVMVLCEAKAIRPILDVFLEKRTEVLWRRAVWAVERILRSEGIACEVSVDQNVGTELVEAFQHGDYQTKLIAEKALKHVDKLPNFSGIISII